MPAHNSSRFLTASVESILGQTYRNLELLITDDGSSDGTRELLKALAEKDPRVKVDYLPQNGGPAVARNNGIERASGNYIAFCDSDDLWIPEKLEKQIRYMEAHDCALCSASYFLCDEAGEVTGVVHSPDRLTLKQMKRDNKIGCLTAIYDVRKLGRKFLFPLMRKRQDWALFLTILKETSVSCGCITEPLAYYRTNKKESLSRYKFGLVKYNVAVYQSVFGYSRLKSWILFFFRFMPAYTYKKLKVKRDSCRLLHSAR